MIRNHTTSLLYRHYTHQLVFNGDDGPQALAWADREIPGQFRRHTRRMSDAQQRVTSIFCNGTAFSRLMEGCDARPNGMRVPLNDEAENLLLNGIRLDIREKLYWNRYRYSMRFWVRWGLEGDNGAELIRFIGDRLGRPRDCDYKLLRSSYFPAIYLSCQSQLAILRLSEPPAKVISTTAVYTRDEVQQAIR